MPWFKKPSDGVYWSDFASVGLNLHSNIYRIWNKSKSKSSDNKLASIKVDLKLN
jgi:hypothetical protein